MIIGFEVENFLSIKNRQELSMVATMDRDMEASHCIAPETAAGLKLLKAAAVYGANASREIQFDKSNPLHARFYTYLDFSGKDSRQHCVSTV